MERFADLPVQTRCESGRIDVGFPISTIQFIDVWRQKETATKASQYTNMLLANATHEGTRVLPMIVAFNQLIVFSVRTPLGNIIK